jgi:hypothetical protein
MRFLNHHYTHNIDGTTCARLKRTPTTIKITKHGQCETNSPEIDWGKTSTPSIYITQRITPIITTIIF